MKELLDRISVERLEFYANNEPPFGYTGSDIQTMARIALAVKQAKPVAYTSVDALADVACDLTGMMGPKNVVGSVPLYAMPLPEADE